MYLCNTVHCVKNSFLLHVHKFRMIIVCVERKNGLTFMETKKNLILMLYFVYKNRIVTTTMQLGSLELVYDIY
jgi:hypothetical protein